MTHKKPAARGRLKPMRSSPAFREFVLDQLGGVPKLRSQAMFGGVGLYSDEYFFGLIAADVLYLKVDDTNLAAYKSAGSRPFTPYPGRTMTMGYYEVPVGVLESADTLVEWARRSVAVAQAARKTPAAKKGKRR